MKAEELMIGSMVSITEDKIPIPCAIVELRSDTLLVRPLGCEDCEAVGYNQIFPIPLTVEILEKNGFVKHSNKAFRYLNEDTRIEINFYLGCGAINITKNWYLEDEITFTLPEPYWVSDYQHALRLCGLTELADNFKIE